jgi:hypothetical protein
MCILSLFLPKMHASLEIKKDDLVHFSTQNRYTLPFRPCVGVSLILMLIDDPIGATT